MPKLSLLATTTMLLLHAHSTLAASQEWNTPSKDIFFQAFHWESPSSTFYKTLSSQVQKLSTLHVTHAWLPPPAAAADQNGYLPTRLSVMDSKYGTSTELKSLVSSMKNKGITAVYDAVFNHRAGTESWCDFTEPTWPSYFVASDDESCGSGICTNPKSSPASTGCATLLSDTGGGFNAARDLDYANPEVVTAMKTFMCSMRADKTSKGLEMPYGGLRFDFVRGYATNILNEFSAIWTDDTWCKANTNFTFTAGTSPEQSFCVAENWVDGLDLVSNCNGDAIFKATSNLRGYANAVNCGSFDFPTKFALTCALNNNDFSLLKTIAGTPPGLAGVEPMRAVTFIDNHDTGDGARIGSGQRLLALFTSSSSAEYTTKLSQAYAYLLTHPGTPSIFHPHLLAFGAGTPLATDIQALADIRHTFGIQNNALVYICQASSDGGNLYSAYISPGGKGNYTLAMKIGSKTWCPHFQTGACAGTLLASGNDWAVWTKESGVGEPACFNGN